MAELIATVDINQLRSIMTKTYSLFACIAVVLLVATPYLLTQNLQFTVNSLVTDTTYAYDDPNTPEDESFDGICADQNGRCTLEAALEEAFFVGKPVTLRFTTTGVINHSFELDSASQLIGNGKTIFAGAVILLGDNRVSGGIFREGIVTAFGDKIMLGGSTAEANKFGKGSQVVISGKNCTLAYNLCGTEDGSSSSGGLGVFVAGGNASIHHNVISGNTNVPGLKVANASAKIFANAIGCNLLGTKAIPNDKGIVVEKLAGDTLVIGASGEPNVINGNSTAGVYSRQTNYRLTNAMVGLDRTGAIGLGNGTGVNHLSGNLRIDSCAISGNKSDGIRVLNDSTYYTSLAVSNCSIGCALKDTTKPLPNGGDGIAIFGNVTRCRIVGRDSTSQNDNLILYNRGRAVSFTSTLGFSPRDNFVHRNKMYGNAKGGVVFGDSIAQRGMKPPMIDSMKSSGGALTVFAHGDSLANSFDVYIASGNAGEHGQAKQYLGSVIGSNQMAFVLPPFVTTSDLITVQAHSVDSNSSEYSANVVATETTSDVEHEQVASALIFPNPVVDYCTLDLRQFAQDKTLTISIFNSVFSLVQQFSLRETGLRTPTLDFTGLSNGVYAVIIEQDGMKKLARVTVLR